MKKTFFAAITATLLLGSHAIAAKVTYEDAVASSSGFYEANNAVNKSPSLSGLGDKEKPESGSANEMGKWVKVSSTLVDWVSSGEYGIALSPNALGKSCVKGSKGLLAKQTTLPAKKVCASGHTDTSGKYICHYYKTEPETTIADSSKGYRAECK
ncbi:hypothetical protein [Vibrio harveyi]|uniref:hypothetical protein n=1 Tax=Vibrio harveyi TaxID=669 RepID=UPI00034C4718|nr:hypothetical protein [Vibrio harveyi]